MIPAAVHRSTKSLIGEYHCVATHTGLSGATIFHLQSTLDLASTTHRQFALRRWPSGTARRRVNEVHEIMKASRAAGCSLVPSVHDVNTLEDRSTWDLTDWLAGSPLPIDSPLKDIVTGTQALAAFHNSVAHLAVQTGVPQAVIDRVNRIAEIKRDEIAKRLAQRAASLHERLRPLAFRAAEVWSKNQATIQHELQALQATALPLQWVLRDVHREHILFTKSESSQATVSGIIDFDALRIDTPATDLARYLASFDQVDLGGGLHADSKLSDLLAVYSVQRPFSDQELDLVVLIAKATLLIAALNWGQWLCLDDRSWAAGQEKAINRFEETVKRAEMLF